MLALQCDSFVTDAGDRPLLVSYGDDGTPVKAMRVIQYVDLQGKPATRRGRKTVECLAQQLWMRYLEANGECKSRCLLREPIALVYGKTGDALFSCGKDFYLYVRAKGHSGITIAHTAFDGAMFPSWTGDSDSTICNNLLAGLPVLGRLVVTLKSCTSRNGMWGPSALHMVATML